MFTTADHVIAGTVDNQIKLSFHGISFILFQIIFV